MAKKHTASAGTGIKPYKTGMDSLTSADLQTLIVKIGNLRDKVLIQLGVMLGPRRGDIVRIKIEHISIYGDGSYSEVTYKEAKKKNAWHTGYCDEPTTRLLQQYMKTLPKGTKYLFPSTWGELPHLSSRQAWNILDKYLKAADLRPRPFHALRSTCIKLLRQAGWTEEEVARQVNDTIRTIQEHYTTPSEGEMQEKVQNKPLFGGGWH